MTYRLPDEAREFVLFQRTALLPKRQKPGRLLRALERLGLRDNSYEKFVRDYARQEPALIDQQYFEDMGSVAARLLPHVPSQTSSILDIGCGIAGLDVFLHKALDGPDLILLDKTAIESKVWYMFEAKGAFYNSLELARDTLVQNGVPDDKITCMQAPETGEIALPKGSVDLVVSTISWGFHYPVSTYAKSVRDVLSPQGALILDVRKDTGGESTLEEFFALDVIDEQPKFNTIKATVLSR